MDKRDGRSIGNQKQIYEGEKSVISYLYLSIEVKNGTGA